MIKSMSEELFVGLVCKMFTLNQRFHFDIKMMSFSHKKQLLPQPTEPTTYKPLKTFWLLN